MAHAPKLVPITLSPEERAALAVLVRGHHTGQALVQRARMVLACAEAGATNTGVAHALGVSRPCVTTWRARFAAHRLDGLVDAPRPGVPRPGDPRRVEDDEVARLVALALETQPEGATHWSTRAMARRAGMSQTMVSRIWQASGLAPHRAETFRLPSGPAFVDKVRDVVGLTMNPPDRALVLCVDEKPQIQAV